ncbi:hypothetical protein H0266_13995 [Halobacillus locisalis]|uniref:Uncharacterized protein n=1 Tax=Halobacillus locisalis TaxID=220753 RepID=A0A838CVP7_9BACI|nr:hypothetical protein [Halobacillus locisalis]MBA2176004.1 hypothetical protein [Halobacillus locisalis]
MGEVNVGTVLVFVMVSQTAGTVFFMKLSGRLSVSLVCSAVMGTVLVFGNEEHANTRTVPDHHRLKSCYCSYVYNIGVEENVGGISHGAGNRTS